MKLTEKEGALFWNWFSQHSSKFHELNDHDLPQLFGLLDQNLSEINRDLSFEFSRETNNGIRELIISANGIVDAFPDVINLVRCAPKLEGWEIIPFKPGGRYDEIIYKNIKLGVNDVYFVNNTAKNHPPIDVILFIKGYEVGNSDWVGATFILLDAVVGEYDVGTKLGHIDFRPYDERLKENVISIKALPELFNLSE